MSRANQMDSMDQLPIDEEMDAREVERPQANVAPAEGVKRIGVFGMDPKRAERIIGRGQQAHDFGPPKLKGLTKKSIDPRASWLNLNHSQPVFVPPELRKPPTITNPRNKRANRVVAARSMSSEPLIKPGPGFGARTNEQLRAQKIALRERESNDGGQLMPSSDYKTFV